MMSKLMTAQKKTTKDNPRNSVTKTDLSRKLKILFIASEAVPFVKTGGLGDVCGTLPKALKKLGHDVRLVLPRYWAVDRYAWKLTTALAPMGVEMGDRTIWCEALKGKADGFTVYFIEHEQYFGRAGLYDDGNWEHPDNLERFGFFSKAALQLAKDIKFRPDIVHAHDWQAALAPAYLKTVYKNDPFFKKTASVFSIHNIAYQGTFKSDQYEFLGLGAENFRQEVFENYQGINLMKGAIFFADGISTVSPTYAREILSEPGGNGLSDYLNRRREDISGVLNGADYDHWDPAVDKLLPARYTADDLHGKTICKRVLQEEFQLDIEPKAPVIGVISRFTQQKGFQNLMPVVANLFQETPAQMAILGTGEKWQEDFFRGLPAAYRGRAGAWIGYSNRKAHLIEAGADFLLVPSLYEPCGLNQMYSLRYGTLPIVRATGGLKDTVVQYEESTGAGTGFLFYDATPGAILETVKWAVRTYLDRPKHIEILRRRAMRQSFPWSDSAKHYEAIYQRARKRRLMWL
ncbi:MAG: glycogen synthase GlgA [Candidatus Omnitrophota bacterium]|jgi:starch synthase